MQWTRLIGLFVILLGVGSLRAADTNPLRFFPAKDTEIVAVVPHPRALIESIRNHPRGQDALTLPQVREFLDSADLRRVFQILAYYERDLGAKWPELLDQISGDGLAIGTKFGSQNALFLAVMQGRDAKQTKKLIDLVVKLVEEELARNGVKEGVLRRKYQGIEAIELSKDLKIAQIDEALLLSNNDNALKAGIDQHISNKKDAKPANVANTSVQGDVKKLLGGQPLAWLWLNLKPVKELPQAKDVFASPRNDVVQTVLFAGWLDVARRADFIAAGFYREQDDLKFTIRMPAGRLNTAPDVELHLPADPKVGGSLPPFDLPGMIACHSFYLDLDTFYSKKEKIFPAQVANDIANGEKQLSRVLINTSLPKLLAASGVHHRIVAVQPETVPGYKKVPQTRLPAFAFVTTMRDESFAKSMNSIVKAAALAAGNQASLRSWEDTLDDVPVFGYSFPDEGKFPDDPQNLRFNYQPTFGHVNGQYFFASNKGIATSIIKAIKAEGKPKAANANLQTAIVAKGFSDFTNVSPELPLVGMILSQGVPLDVAKMQTAEFYQFLDKLGKINVKTEYTDTEFHLDIIWKLGK